MRVVGIRGHCNEILWLKGTAHRIQGFFRAQFFQYPYHLPFQMQPVVQNDAGIAELGYIALHGFVAVWINVGVHQSLHLHLFWQKMFRSIGHN